MAAIANYNTKVGATSIMAVVSGSITGTSTTSSYSAMGLGAAGIVFKPLLTGTVRVSIDGMIYNNTLSDITRIELAYGTGSAPANGAAIGGTVTGNPVYFDFVPGTTCYMPFSLTRIITGLTAGTTYWFDAGLEVSAGTGSISQVTMTFVEILY